MCSQAAFGAAGEYICCFPESFIYFFICFLKILLSDYNLFKLKSTRIELIIGSLLAKQLIMGSALDDPSMVKNHDCI